MAIRNLFSTCSIIAKLTSHSLLINGEQLRRISQSVQTIGKHASGLGQSSLFLGNSLTGCGCITQFHDHGPHGNACRAIQLQTARSLKSTSVGHNITTNESATDNVRLETLVKKARISCTDYSHEQISCREGIDSASLEVFLQQPRPSWSKVRWLLVEGYSLDALQILGRKYEIHPLALEDAGHIPQRVKADFYENHLFLSMVTVALDCPVNMGSTARYNDTATLRALQANTAWARPIGVPGRPLQVCVEQASIFLFRDGTVISLFQHQGRQVHQGIRDSLTAGTLLRDTEDASLLVHRLVDTIVDQSIPVADHYAQQINEIEAAVLEGDVSAPLTRSLHLLQSELNLLKKALAPTQHMVATLKSKDKDFSKGNPQRQWLSPTTRTYLEDVHDHTLTLVEHMEMSIRMAADLIDLIFNSISHETNMSMQTLAVVSTIFLPISFLAGVYGTNFANIPECQWEHGYAYFWALCVASTSLFLLLLSSMGIGFKKQRLK